MTRAVMESRDAAGRSNGPTRYIARLNEQLQHNTAVAEKGVMPVTSEASVMAYERCIG
jgi:hypothetical protein